MAQNKAHAGKDNKAKLIDYNIIAECSPNLLCTTIKHEKGIWQMNIKTRDKEVKHSESDRIGNKG